MLVQPGVTTDAIDKAVHQMIIDNGAYPSPLTYGEQDGHVVDLTLVCLIDNVLEH